MEAELVIMPEAGHSAREVSTSAQLKEFADRFRDL